jgi:hypothetical protein
MSQQPPEGAYAQPQDPWEGGYEPGLASVPTDPIPEQRFEGYPAPGAEVWSQQTVAHGGYVPQQAPNRTGMIVLIVLIVLILGGGGGYAAYYVTSKRNPSANPTVDPTTGETATSTPTPTFDPYAVEVDDCIRNNNGNVPNPDNVDANPDIDIVPCATDGSFKVIKIVVGDQLKRNAQGELDRDTTAPAACGDTPYKYWYAYDANDDTQDLFFCLVAAGSGS